MFGLIKTVGDLRKVLSAYDESLPVKFRVSGFECVFCSMTGARHASVKPDFVVAFMLASSYTETGLRCV